MLIGDASAPRAQCQSAPGPNPLSPDVEVYRAEPKASNPDSSFACLLGYLRVVCGDQKYSNTIPGPGECVHFFLLSGTPRNRTKTAPNPDVEVYFYEI